MLIDNSLLELSASLAYMDETICFKEQSQVFSSCRDSVAMKVSKLEMELAELNITDVKFTEDICK